MKESETERAFMIAKTKKTPILFGRFLLLFGFDFVLRGREGVGAKILEIHSSSSFLSLPISLRSKIACGVSEWIIYRGILWMSRKKLKSFLNPHGILARETRIK